MTVAANVSRVTFAGDDVTTSFDLGSDFVFFEETELQVSVVTDATGAEEDLVLNVDYTVSGGDGATGTVDTSGGSSPHGALLDDTTLVIRRVLPLTQSDDFVNGEITDAEVIEDRFDRLTMIAQQLEDESARALRAPATEDEIDPLPTRANRRGKYFKFDDSTAAAPEAVEITELGSGLILDEDDFASDSATDAPSQQSVKAWAENDFLIDEDDFTSDSATRPPSQQSAKAYVDDATAGLLPGFLHGCTMSNGTDAAHDIDIAAGKATLENGSGDDKTFTVSAITKQIDANWAAGTGAGGFPSGLTLSADTTYHVFLIGKDDGTEDAGFDTSLTATNLLSDASGYSWFKRIGSLYTDASSNWVSFSQNGDEFLIDPVNDYNAVDPGTSAVLQTLSVPTGIQVDVKHVFGSRNTSPTVTGRSSLITSPDVTDTAPSTTLFTIMLTNVNDASGNAAASAEVIVRTDTSGRVRHRSSGSSASFSVIGTTLGWIDNRGKLS